jgi:hypothetical protein
MDRSLFDARLLELPHHGLNLIQGKDQIAHLLECRPGTKSKSRRESSLHPL